MVLLIFSLLAGLVVPRLTRMYDSFQIALQRDDILSQLSSLNYAAFQQSINFTLTNYPPNQDEESNHSKTKSETTPTLPLELPDGWQIRAEKPITFRANGACSGGIIDLEYQEQTFRIQLDPPFCQAKLLNN